MDIKLKDGGRPGDTAPSDKQKAYGNYPKGHAVIHGMRISVENAKGTMRRGVDPEGKAWEQKLAHDYGYVRGTTGKDKDHIDVFLGPKAQDQDAKVWVIDQNKKGSDEFDEHKVALGFDDMDDAIIGYHQNYEPGWKGFRSVTAMDVPTFKSWAYSGKSGKRKPAAEYVAFKENGDGDKDVEGRGQHNGGADLRPGVQRDVAAESLRAARGDADAAGVHAENDNPQQRQGGSVQGRGLGGGMQGRIRSLGDRLAAKSLRSTDDRTTADGQASGLGHGSQRDDAPQGFADGGTVDPEGLYTPYIGYRSPKRKHGAPEASKSAPASAVRGVVAGTAGLPGDVEGILRQLASSGVADRFAKTLGGVLPGLGIAQKALGSSGDDTARLPTSEFYNEWLPGRAEGAVNRAAEFGGNTFGLMPHEVGKVAGKVATPAVDAAKALIKSQAPKIERAMLGAAPMAKPMYAVKAPGGNWYDPIAEAHLNVGDDDITIATPSSVVPSWADAMLGDTSEVGSWLQKRAIDWMQNKMGTVDDPLIGLEREGRLHLPPGQLQEYGNFARNDINKFVDPGGDIHRAFGGTGPRSLWENITDQQIESWPSRDKTAKSLTDQNIDPTEWGGEPATIEDLMRDTPEWVEKAWAAGKPVHSLNMNREGVEGAHDVMSTLGLDHIADYLQQATQAHRHIENSGGINKFREYIARDLNNRVDNDALRFFDNGLAIDPKQLNKMGFADVAGKVGDWNKKMEEWSKEAARLKDWNKGVKEVLKQYPDQKQWVELDHTGLGDEGEVMGHCVGGYCNSVQAGERRILSLRDKNGPHVTVELVKPSPSDQIRHQQDTYRKWVEEANKASTSENPSEFAQFARAQENSKWDQGKLINRYLQSKGQPNLEIPTMPWNIRQIKGKANLAPNAEYLPAVQDLVKNMGPWGDDIHDLQNTGLKLRDRILAEGAPISEGYDVFNTQRARADTEHLGKFVAPGDVASALAEKGWVRLKGGRTVHPEDFDADPRIRAMSTEERAGLVNPEQHPKLNYASGGAVGLGGFGMANQLQQSTGGNGWGFTGVAPKQAPVAAPVAAPMPAAVAPPPAAPAAPMPAPAAPPPPNGGSSEQMLRSIGEVGSDIKYGTPEYWAIYDRNAARANELNPDTGQQGMQFGPKWEDDPNRHKGMNEYWGDPTQYDATRTFLLNAGMPGMALDYGRAALAQKQGWTPEETTQKIRDYELYTSPGLDAPVRGLPGSNAAMAGAGTGGLPPSLNMNDPADKAKLAEWMKTAGAGATLSGLQAFTGAYAGPWANRTGGTDNSGFGGTPLETNIRPLLQTAAQTGFDVSNYNLNPADRNNDIQKLYDDMDKALSGYHNVHTLSSNYGDNSRGERGNANILYKDDGTGVWNPMYVGKKGEEARQGNYFQQNPDLMGTLSVLLMGVGGVGGLANMAGAGLSGGSLAAANIAGGAAMGAAGGGEKGALLGALSGAGGYAGGAAGNAVAGQAGQALGSQIGSQAGKYAANQINKADGGSVGPLSRIGR